MVAQSNYVVVVEETSTRTAAWGFILFGLLAIPLYRSILGAAIGAFFMMFGLYASVASSFVADRGRRLLVVTRRLGRLEFKKQYDATDIEEIFVRYTRKGSGLALRFRSGRTKSLTMSLGAPDNLDRAAGALTAYLFVPKRGGHHTPKHEPEP